jgi:ferritin
MPGMADPKFLERLNAQLGSEFAAHHQYLSIAAYYDGLTMPQMAGFFYRQAAEERDHAMMMIRYLIDSDADVEIPGVTAPAFRFPDITAPVALALEQERRVQAEVHELLSIARRADDFASDQFMQWFVKEQVEEIATMNDLLTVVRRRPDSIEAIEDYVARETVRAGVDPTAPRVAGA